jgi:predicted Zn-dependent protease
MTHVVRSSLLVATFFAAALFAAPLVGQAVTPPPIPPQSVSDSQEIALGAMLARQFDRDRGLENPTEQNRRMEAYLQSIADSIAPYTRRRLPWRMHYDSHPGFRSGFALPGGHIVIGAGILALMSTEDEAAAVIAHEIIHIDENQVSGRITQLMAKDHRSLTDSTQWRWGEFGRSYGPVLENWCDYDGAKLAVKAHYSPYAYEMILQTFVVIGGVQSPKTPAPKAITDRITQIRNEIQTEHWEQLTKTRPIALPYSND